MTNATTPPAAPTVPLYPQLGSPTFNSEAYTYATTMPAVVTGIQALANNSFTNATAAYERSLEAAASASSAQALVAFKGDWSTLAGALNMPATVLYANAYWVLTRNVANVAEEVPSVSTAWSPQILDARPLANGTDLNTALASGRYSVTNPTNAPAMTGSTGECVVEVVKFGTNAVQELTLTLTRRVWRRRISGIGTSLVYGAWALMSEDNPTAVAVAGGAIDCSLGVYFTTSIASNITLVTSNIPAGAYSFVLEVYHTGGSITLPADAVYVGAAIPSLVLNRRHLFFFQRAVGAGTGGWIVSTLPNSAP